MSEAPIARPAGRRLRMGTVWVDVLTFGETLREIERLVWRKQFASVFTPNVDHVVKASTNTAFREAYDRVTLSVADGMPLIWVSPLLGCALPERVAGSDLLMPVLNMAARNKWRVYLLGGAPGVAPEVATLLTEKMGITVAGWDDCRIDQTGTDADGSSFERARAARPDIILVALGPPKQELWIDRAREIVGPAVCLGVGASLDFLVGKYKRAPRWMGRIGLEWAYRLAQEPKRLWRRYLVEGPRFIGIVGSTWQMQRSDRVIPWPAESSQEGGGDS